MLDVNCTCNVGVSGILRVKDDAEFVEACIDSCIEALDELIIVYNDCSDNSPELIYKKLKQYPDKIKVYEYKHKVYSINLTKEEYEYAKSLPQDSPNLLCNYYNFALSKVSYKYAMKIDADQIYFSDELRKVCDMFRSTHLEKYSISVIIGYILFLIYRFISKFCSLLNIVFPVYTFKLTKKLYPFYLSYVKYMISRDKCMISLSGINIFKECGKFYVPLGLKNDRVNILPPMNGVGDHLIFKVSGSTYYRAFDDSFYSMMRSDQYTLIEQFEYPKCKLLPVGLMWYHLNSMRHNIYGKVKKVKESHPEVFEDLACFCQDTFFGMEKKIDNRMVSKSHILYFQWLYSVSRDKIQKFTSKLEQIQI